MHTVYSVVVAPKGLDEQLEAYLYSHSAFEAQATAGRITAYLLRTDAINENRAVGSCNFQCDRFLSGLYTVYSRCKTRSAALNDLKHVISNEIDALDYTRT